MVSRLPTAHWPFGPSALVVPRGPWVLRGPWVVWQAAPSSNRNFTCGTFKHTLLVDRTVNEAHTSTRTSHMAKSIYPVISVTIGSLCDLQTS